MDPKSLYSAIRLGYVVVPHDLVSAFPEGQGLLGQGASALIVPAGALVGSNPRHAANHFVLQFGLSFQSPGKWLRDSVAPNDF